MNSGLTQSTSSDRIPSTDSVKLSKARVQKEKPSESAPIRSINDRARKANMSISVQSPSSVDSDHLQRLPQNHLTHRNEAPDTRRQALNNEHSNGDAGTNRERSPSRDDQRSYGRAAPKRTRCPSLDNDHLYEGATSKDSVAKTTERKRARKRGQELELNRLKCNLNDLPTSSSRKRSHFNDNYVFPEQKKNKRKKESLELSQSTILPVLSNIGDDTPNEKSNEIIIVSDDSESDTESLNMSAEIRNKSSETVYPRDSAPTIQTECRPSSRASSRGASPVTDLNSRSGGFPTSSPSPSLPPPLPTQNMSCAATDEQRERTRQEPDSDMSLRPELDMRQILKNCAASREKKEAEALAVHGKEGAPDYELQLTAYQKKIIFSSLTLDDDYCSRFTCTVCKEVMPDFATGRWHAVSHIRVQRMRCKLCNAGSFYQWDLIEHLAQGLCPNIANASQLFQCAIASKKITKEHLTQGPKIFSASELLIIHYQLKSYIEVTDKKNPGRVSYTTGPIVSIKSRIPYYPDKMIEEKIIGNRWQSWDDERRKADAEQIKNPIGRPICIYMPTKRETQSSKPSKKQTESTLPSSSQASASVQSSSQSSRPPSSPPPLPTQNMSCAATDEQSKQAHREKMWQILLKCKASREKEQEERLAAFAKPTIVPRNTNRIDQGRNLVPPSTSSSSMITNSSGLSRVKQNLTQIQEDKSDISLTMSDAVAEASFPVAEVPKDDVEAPSQDLPMDVSETTADPSSAIPAQEPEEENAPAPAATQGAATQLPAVSAPVSRPANNIPTSR